MDCKRHFQTCAIPLGAAKTGNLNFMLSDRNYDRYGPTGMRRRSGASMLALLVVANITMFILQAAFLEERTFSTPYGVATYQTDKFTENFALISTAVMKGEAYRVVTYMFLHGGFWHILFNMWGLYLFGSLLEQRIGANRFLWLYFLSGFAGAAFWLVLNRSSDAPCVGASGAIFGIIIATAMFYPDLRIMLLFPPVPLKLRTFAIVYIIAEIFLEVSKSGGGIAHIVHLGGGLAGYIFMKILYGKESEDIFSGLKFGGSKTREGVLDASGWQIKTTSVPQSELDRILDKISESGVNSLTDEEMEMLNRAREEMKGPKG